MKIIVSSMGKTLNSQLDLRFGRAAIFTIMETNTMEYKALDNIGAASSGGAVINKAMEEDKSIH